LETARLLGQKIDQYRIERPIDRGGMADVYLALDEDLGRHVAFKVMLDVLVLDEQYVRRFQREARTVARLDHSNIVKVYSTGKTPFGQPYIAMQYIEGGSLREKLAELAERNKLLTTEQILNIMRQLAAALGVAHKAGVVHRDLKPSNILVRPDGTPVLVDLGIAAVQSGAKLTHTGGFMGTPAYMSPEQVWGKQTDGRSDLYSLGIIFYELFAGAQPFYADEMPAIMYMQVNEEPAPLAKIRPDLSPQTVSIVETLLNKEPKKRFQTAEELVIAIDHAIRTQVGHGPNPQATEVLTRLDDSALISRPGILQFVQAATAGNPVTSRLSAAKSIPLWVIVTFVVLLLILAGFVFLSPDSGPGQSTATLIAGLPTRSVVETELPTQEITGAAATTTPTQTPFPTQTLLPTATVTEAPSPTGPPTNTPTITPIPVCEGASPTQLEIGGRAAVINYQLNVRTGSGTTFPLVNRLQVGRQVTITDGPRCSERMLWYYIVADDFTNSQGQVVHTEGWSIEESGDEYFLSPIN
jgi:serine/threonine protein kinase